MTYIEEFITRALNAAGEAGISWPDYQVAEAALESNWGRSQLAIQANNLFGMKMNRAWAGETISIPTREYSRGQWMTVPAVWLRFPDWRSAFTNRMMTLRRLAPTYPHYANALAATDGETFVREVSQTWSTDPARADKVLQIYAAHRDQLLSANIPAIGEIPSGEQGSPVG